MKLLDNVIGRPGDFRTRSIRIRNPNFFSKVGRFPGGIQVLRVAGFVEVLESGAPHLQLPVDTEDSAKILKYWVERRGGGGFFQSATFSHTNVRGSHPRDVGPCAVKLTLY